MKYVLIAVVFSICVFVGFVFSAKYTKRKKFFSSIIALADKLSLEINFSRERLKVLIENFDENSKRDLLGIDKKFVDFLDRKVDLSTSELFGKNDVIKNDEKELTLLFFKTLGRSDVENQTKEIQSFVKRFSEIKQTCDAEQKKYGSLSLKLGVVAGLLFAVIMI
ncbi:MAG: stage III sporulation protein AB [Clostridia bacterium]|nr:stage III sporulation protein AB [Clostridia bacterium]